MVTESPPTAAEALKDALDALRKLATQGNQEALQAVTNLKNPPIKSPLDHATHGILQLLHDLPHKRHHPFPRYPEV